MSEVEPAKPTAGADDELPFATLSYAPVADPRTVRAMLTLVAFLPVATCGRNGVEIIFFAIMMVSDPSLIRSFSSEYSLEIVSACLPVAVGVTLSIVAWRGRAVGHVRPTALACFGLAGAQFLSATGAYVVSWMRYQQYGMSMFAFQTFVTGMAAVVLPLAAGIILRRLAK